MEVSKQEVIDAVNKFTIHMLKIGLFKVKAPLDRVKYAIINLHTEGSYEIEISIYQYVDHLMFGDSDINLFPWIVDKILTGGPTTRQILEIIVSEMNLWNCDNISIRDVEDQQYKRMIFYFHYNNTMKITEEQLDLSEDELRFRNNPKIITFVWQAGYGQTIYGFYCKSTTIKTIKQDEYYETMRNYNGITKIFNTYYPDDESRNIHFREVHTTHAVGDGWLYRNEFIKNLAFLEALKNEYKIDEYLLVPAYYEKLIFESGIIMVSLNEFKLDFPEIEIKNITHLSKNEGFPTIGYIDYYVKYGEYSVKIWKKMDSSNKIINNVNNENYRKYKNYNIKLYNLDDSIEVLRKKMLTISLKYFEE